MQQIKEEKKNPFIILSGVNVTVPQGQTKNDAIILTIPNKNKNRIHGFVLRYKPGLDDCGINIVSSDQSTGKIIEGYLSFAVAGSPYGVGAPGYSIFPIPGRKPIVPGSATLRISLTAQGAQINAREVSIGILAEEID